MKALFFPYLDHWWKINWRNKAWPKPKQLTLYKQTQTVRQ